MAQDCRHHMLSSDVMMYPQSTTIPRQHAVSHPTSGKMTYEVIRLIVLRTGQGYRQPGTNLIATALTFATSSRVTDLSCLGGADMITGRLD